MAVALEQFVKQLADSGVIAPGKLESFVPPKAQPKDSQELARLLVQSKCLTKFQAQEIYAGRAKSLILGNYTILDKIGAGGMGQVFKAEHRRMDRIVAIKMLPKNVMRDVATIARFEREVKAGAKLSHPNIVTAHDADEAGGINFLVMEYVEGSDLSALVKENGSIPVAKAVGYILQAAKGLEFAHKKGVIHRDVKPANLLLDSEGTIKILDMGLARIDKRDVAATELTSAGAMLGTVNYMAPEQAVSTRHADARADIYGLGCTLHYLLTGRPTYEGDTIVATILAHRETPIPSLGTEVPRQVQAVFERMVAKKADDRYQTMSEVVAELQDFAEPTSTGEDTRSASESLDDSRNLSILAAETVRHHDSSTKRAKPITEDATSIKNTSGQNRRNLLLTAGGLIGRISFSLRIGISFSLLLIAGLGVFGVSHYLHGREVTRQTDSLASLLDAGDLSGARTLIDEIGQKSPSVAASDEVQRLGERLDAAERTEAKRHESFELALRRARSASPESPDNDALNDANKFATTAVEKAELKQHEDTVASAERGVIAKRDAEFTTALIDFQNRLKRLEAGPNDNLPAALDEVVQFRSDFKATEDRLGSMNGAVRSQIGPMLTRIDTVEAALRRRGREGSQLEFITKAVGDSDAYQEALAGYIRHFPDAPRSADFRTALEDAPLWLGLAKWNELLTSFRKENLAALDPETAKTLLAAANRTLKDYGNYPNAESIRRFVPYLEADGRRVDSQNARITEPLKQLFNDPLMSDVWTIELIVRNRKEIFYLKKTPELDPDKSTPVSYIAGFDMAEKPVPGGVRGGAPLRNSAAPQVSLAKTIRKQLGQLNDANWDRTFFLIVQTILADDPPIDPILKCNLLKQTLDVGCRGSRAFEKAFAPQLAALQAANIDPTANWLDPTNQIAQKNRDNAEALFHGFPDINAAGKAAADDLAELRKPVGTPLRWVGWLRRGGAGAWRCNLDRLGSESGDLVMAVKTASGGATLVHIGKLERGIPEIVGKDDQSLVEGRPVYLEFTIAEPPPT